MQVNSVNPFPITVSARSASDLSICASLLQNCGTGWFILAVQVWRRRDGMRRGLAGEKRCVV